MYKPKVKSFTIDRKPLKNDTLKKLFHLDSLPNAPSIVTIEISGIPTAYINGIRRVGTDEMKGYALNVKPGGFKIDLTTDPFMLPPYVEGRISLIRLSARAGMDKLRFKLDVTNNGATQMGVYAGDLEIVEGSLPIPIFNPTTKIAFIQPGKRIVIHDIYVSDGYGRENSIYNVLCRASYSHLDIPQYSDDDMRKENGVAADWSGYKVSSLVANPLHHLLSATIPATSSNKDMVYIIFIDICTNIIERLRLANTAIETASNGIPHREAQYTVVKLNSGISEGILRMIGETYTIGELIRRTVYDLNPNIVNVSYTIISHENNLNLSVRHTDNVTKILIDAIQHIIDTFEKIKYDFTQLL